MAVQFPEPQLQPNSGLTFPWAFMTRDAHEANWGGSGQRVVEKMIIKWADYVDMTAQSQLCGYSTTDGNVLNRVIPWSHPQFGWLFVDEEQGISGVRPLGRPLKLVQNPSPYVIYKYVVLTLVFTERHYTVLGGSFGLDGNGNIIPPVDAFNGGGEQNRYVEFIDKGTAEYIQLNTGSFQYDPGDPNVQKANLASPPHAFKQGLAILDTKDTITLTWHLVPHGWIHNGLGIMSNILAGLSTVNAFAFLGFPPGTLFFDSHDKERRAFPIATNTAVGPGGKIQPIGTMTWAWNVSFFFKYRNPRLGIDGRLADVNGNPFKQGHNVAPAPQDLKGYWYPIVGSPDQQIGPGPGGLKAAVDNLAANILQGQDQGTTGGRPLYLSSDFSNLFKKAV